MAKGFGIHGSSTSHGGTVISTQSRSSQMGNLFLRAGDGFACPKCKCWSTLIKSNDHVIFDGKAVAYVGDKFTCGATLLPKQDHVVGDSGGSSTQSSNSSITNSFINSNHDFEAYYEFEGFEDRKYIETNGSDSTQYFLASNKTRVFTDRQTFEEIDCFLEIDSFAEQQPRHLTDE